MALCRSKADHIVVASRSQSRVEPSMSVNRNVTTPEGGVRGVIGVEGRAIKNVEFTKQDRRDVGRLAAGSFRFSLFWRCYGPRSTPRRVTVGRIAPACTYTRRRTQ